MGNDPLLGRDSGSGSAVVLNGTRLKVILDLIKIISVMAAIIWAFADLKGDVRIMANDISQIKVDLSRLEALHFGNRDGR